MAKKMSAFDMTAFILLLIGGLNWGLVGLFSFDLVRALFGTIPVLQNAVYTLVGVAALYNIYVFYMKK